MPDLAIAALDAFPLREPVSRRAYTVLRLRTRSGLEGFGECRTASAADLDQARRIVTGRPATACEPIRRNLAATPGVQAAVNMALLDLAGKFSKAPVYQLLGGPTRGKARAMAPLSGSSDAEILASLQRARSAGFRAVSVPVLPPAARNQGQVYMAASRKRMEALREAAGDVDFVLDAASVLTPGDASVLSATLERFHLLWLDEPCRLVNLEAVRKISAENVTPLGFGRHLRQAADYQELLRQDAVDILRPDLSEHGITQIRRIAALAETYYIAVAPFHEGGPIATAAALHLAASLPNFFIQQIPFPEAEADRRMRSELTGKSVEMATGGYLPLPSGPGLGIEVSPTVLEKYQERA